VTEHTLDSLAEEKERIERDPKMEKEVREQLLKNIQHVEFEMCLYKDPDASILRELDDIN
jgi:hypothetical protein